MRGKRNISSRGNENGAVDTQTVRRGALLIFTIASAIVFVVVFLSALLGV